jgi:hypothetical protein
MKNSTLVTILKTFTGNEMNRFGDFISCSSGFSTHSVLPRRKYSVKMLKSFYNILENNYPDFDSKELYREKIYKKLFNNEKYNDKKFRNLKSDMVHLCEMYLSVNWLMKNTYGYNHILNEVLFEKKLDSLLDKNINSSFVKLRKRKSYTSDFLYDQFKLVYTKRNFYRGKKTLGSSKFYNILDDEIKAFTDYILFYILEYLIALQNSKVAISRDIKQTIDNDFFNHIYAYLENIKNDLGFDINIQVLYYLVSLERNDEGIDSVLYIKSYADQHRKLIATDVYQSCYQQLAFYCLNKLAEGDNDYKDMVYMFLKENFKKNNYIEYNSISISNYLAMAKLAFRFNDLKLAKEIIFKYKSLVDPELREPAFNYIYAYYLRFAGNLSEALKYVSKLKLKDIYYKLDTYNLQLIIYFELGFYKPALNLINSYKKFLKKNTDLYESRRINSINIIDIFYKMIKIISGSNKYDLNDMKREVQENSIFMYKTEMLKKIEELEMRKENI